MTFFYDDFFADPNASVEIHPQLWQNGELVDVPMKVKRRLSLSEREAIKQGSITFGMTADGTITPTIDQERATVLSLMHMLVSWPFSYKNGSPVPINEHTVKALGSTNADAIMIEFGKLDQQKAAVREPFVEPSEAA